MHPSSHHINLFLFSLLLILTAVDAGVTVNETVQCNTQSNVCAYYLSGKSGKSGDARITFFLTKNLNEGQTISNCPKKKRKRCKRKEKVKIRWNSTTNVCEKVDTSVGKCNSCTTCDVSGKFGASDFTATFSADCTNLSGGRSTNCESLFPVYYPLDPKPLKTSRPTRSPTACVGLGVYCGRVRPPCCGDTRCSKYQGCVECTRKGFHCRRNFHCCPGFKCRGDKSKRKSRRTKHCAR
jgi:hypothetical protein